MANDSQIIKIRIALQHIEDYAAACHAKLSRYPDADRDWLLSRTPNMQILVDKLDQACKEAAG